MRATHDPQVIALFAANVRLPAIAAAGSTGDDQSHSRRLAIAFAAALVGFATAATAISVRHSDHTGRAVSAGYNLTGGVPGSAGFEAALY